MMAELILTEEQIDHFDREGFLVLRSNEHGLIDPATLQQWVLPIEPHFKQRTGR